MVFGLFLQRLDQIQLRAVRRNMQQHKLLFQHSAVKNFRLNVVVRRSALSIVQGKQSHGAMTIVRIVVVAGELGEHGDFVWCQRLAEQAAFLDSALFQDGPFWTSGLHQLFFCVVSVTNSTA